MGSDGVAVGELPVIGGQNPPVGERDPIASDRADFDELPVDETVALELLEDAKAAF